MSISTDKFPQSENSATLNIAEHFVDTPAAAHPDRIAITGDPREVTYGELAALANRVGNALRSQGVSRGHRVLIVLPDSAEFMAAFFGAVKIGAVAVPVNPFARTADYIHYIENSEPRAAIVHSEALQEFLPASSKRPQMPIVVVGQEHYETHGVSHSNWSEWTAAASDQLAAEHTSSLDPAFMLYTSGSGGAPKAAVHRHADMLVTTRNYAENILALRHDDLTFSVSKLFFAYGLGNGMYFPLSAGARILLNPERVKVDRVIEMVARHRPAVFFAVPTFYAAVLREFEAAGQPRGLFFRSKVRLCWRNSSRLKYLTRGSANSESKFSMELARPKCCTFLFQASPENCQPGSCGFPVPGYELKIVDENEKSLPDGETGNLWVRGASAFAEYWRIPDLTERSKRGDWVVTGDKFFRDSNGYFHYCGRADDMLKIAGMWVSPVEVENALLGHPQIAEAAVVGENDARGLMYSVAHVVLRGKLKVQRDLRTKFAST